MTFDELLSVVPGLRKARRLNAALLRILLDRRRRECTWCGMTVPRGRIAWCSDKCVADFRERCDPAASVKAVFRRDNGRCRRCGRDVEKSKRVYVAYLRDWPGNWRYPEQHNKVKVMLGFGRGGWWEIDHTIPVCEGGGLCTIDNLRLMCGACHDDETRNLSRRQRRQRELSK